MKNSRKEYHLVGKNSDFEQTEIQLGRCPLGIWFNTTCKTCGLNTYPTKVFSSLYGFSSIKFMCYNCGKFKNLKYDPLFNMTTKKSNGSELI